MGEVIREGVARGPTTTAYLTPLCDDFFKNLIDVEGPAKQFYKHQAASIDRIEKIENLGYLAAGEIKPLDELGRQGAVHA